ncbi:pyridoxamine 5'-phosphate oxidase family protein [Haladaptatus caseinilyticus]|uniref:pyridoxamine 5'-phosphate oxidase family protein n=1 Tax=Haladaptatus caseinilyticus TaxID=2993314 RepID=UPI00224B6385|nr:pyridoxamine 5'-phosphate oxidase family protein [Haladaptatus caseinilyticus]
MGDSQSGQMDDEERDEFLTTGGTGVVSFSTGSDEAPYSRPVSYGYDAATGHFYFRFAIGPNREKSEFVDHPISFVTYDQGESGWRSVIATGTVDDVETADIDSEIIDGMRRVDIPLVDIFDRPSREVSFQFFHFVPDELTSRKEIRTED